jgi:hypothetical protein
MFSHVVIWWTNPEVPNAEELILAGAEKYLRPIPFLKAYHIGRMATSHRPVVDQSYQVAMHVAFEDKAAQDVYQDHPLHLDFVRECKHAWIRVVIYDFE